MGWTSSDEVETEGEAGASMFLKDQQRGDLDGGTGGSLQMLGTQVDQFVQYSYKPSHTGPCSQAEGLCGQE